MSAMLSPGRSPALQQVERTGGSLLVLAMLAALMLLLLVGLTDPAGAETQLRGIRESMDAVLLGWLS